MKTDDEHLDEPGRFALVGDGPVPLAGPFPTRRAALDWAYRWVIEHGQADRTHEYHAAPMLDPGEPDRFDACRACGTQGDRCRAGWPDRECCPDCSHRKGGS